MTLCQLYKCQNTASDNKGITERNDEHNDNNDHNICLDPNVDIPEVVLEVAESLVPVAVVEAVHHQVVLVPSVTLHTLVLHRQSREHPHRRPAHYLDPGATLHIHTEPHPGDLVHGAAEIVHYPDGVEVGVPEEPGEGVVDEHQGDDGEALLVDMRRGQEVARTEGDRRDDDRSSNLDDEVGGVGHHGDHGKAPEESVEDDGYLLVHLGPCWLHQEKDDGLIHEGEGPAREG